MYFKKDKIVKVTLCAIFLGTFMMLFSCETDDTQTVATFTNLVLEDKFNTDGAPNPNLWTAEIGTGPNGDGWGNQELQYYTDRSENLRVENGFLLITADREDFEGSPYTSARIITEGKFEQQFGRFEARIRIPFGSGVWPAFWLLGNDCDVNIWPQCGEIDVMENFGRNASEISGSVHGPGYNAGDAEGKEYELLEGRFDDDFHIFGIEWGPDYVNYYVDSDLYNQITREDIEDLGGEWVFDHPFYILLNLAVGGQPVGDPTNTEFPKTMYVDYVRVYQQ